MGTGATVFKCIDRPVRFSFYIYTSTCVFRIHKTSSASSSSSDEEWLSERETVNKPRQRVREADENTPPVSYVDFPYSIIYNLIYYCNFRNSFYDFYIFLCVAIIITRML